MNEIVKYLSTHASLCIHFFLLQKRKLALKAKEIWLSKVVSKSVASIITHWNFNELKSGDNNLPIASTKPYYKKIQGHSSMFTLFGR